MSSVGIFLSKSLIGYFLTGKKHHLGILASISDWLPVG